MFCATDKLLFLLEMWPPAGQEDVLQVVGYRPAASLHQNVHYFIDTDKITAHEQ